MTTYPKQFAAGEAPAEVLALVNHLVPLLIAGDHAAMTALREQWTRCRVGAIELTGVGFFADLEVPPDAPKSDPPNISGGNAAIELAGAKNGAGCVLFVRDGYLDTLEGYTYNDEWPPDAHVLRVTEVTPIQPALE